MRGSLEQRAAAGSMRALDVLTLGAVALVVLLVSLPRLQDLAVRENEGDARWLTERLGELVAEPGGAPGDIRALLQRQPTLQRLLDDAEYLDDGRLLRRHGYLFEIVGAEEPRERCGAAAVRAWPWSFERTGRRAWLWRCGEPLRTHANAQGRWSGTQRRPELAAAADGWEALGR